MARVERSEMISRILRTCREFSDDVLRIRADIPGYDELLGYAEKSSRLLRDNDTMVEMYKKTGELAVKQRLHMGGVMEDYATTVLADPANLPQKAKAKTKTVKSLMSQVRKFGDEQLTKRLDELELGKSVIAFEEMSGRMEGYTKIENGQIKYCMDKKYRKITAEEDLWRAAIILAHELQRNPETGDLRGETAVIVQKDVTFIEKLAKCYGEKVYKLNPDFLVMHYVREMFGDEGLKKFSDIVFSHDGSYWRAANPHTIKASDRRNYYFSPRISTITAALMVAPGVIPVIGIGATTGLDAALWAADLREIDTGDAILSYLDNASSSADVVSTVIDKLADAIRDQKVRGVTKVGGKLLGLLSFIWTGKKTYDILNENYEMGVDHVISYLFFSELVSNSREGVERLYVRALAHTYRLIEEGHIRFEVNSIGRIVGGRPDFDADEVNMAKDDLLAYRKENNLEPVKW